MQIIIPFIEHLGHARCCGDIHTIQRMQVSVILSKPHNYLMKSVVIHIWKRRTRGSESLLIFPKSHSQNMTKGNLASSHTSASRSGLFALCLLAPTIENANVYLVRQKGHLCWEGLQIFPNNRFVSDRGVLGHVILCVSLISPNSPRGWEIHLSIPHTIGSKLNCVQLIQFNLSVCI